MNSEEILIRLDSDYRKCEKCEKFYHIRKSRIITIELMTFQLGVYCTLCNIISYTNKLLVFKIPIDQLEEVYGFIYHIEKDEFGYIFIKMQDDILDE